MATASSSEDSMRSRCLWWPEAGQKRWRPVSILNGMAWISLYLTCPHWQGYMISIAEERANTHHTQKTVAPLFKYCAKRCELRCSAPSPNAHEGFPSRVVLQHEVYVVQLVRFELQLVFVSFKKTVSNTNGGFFCCRRLDITCSNKLIKACKLLTQFAAVV